MPSIDGKHYFIKEKMSCSCGWSKDNRKPDHYEVQWARHLAEVNDIAADVTAEAKALYEVETEAQPVPAAKMSVADKQGFRYSERLDHILAVIACHKKWIKELDEQVEENASKEIMIQCLGTTAEDQNGCMAEIPVGELIYQQSMYHKPASTRWEVSQWTAGEGRFVCPKCNVENRLHERPKVQALKRFFKSAVNRRFA